MSSSQVILFLSCKFYFLKIHIDGYCTVIITTLTNEVYNLAYELKHSSIPTLVYILYNSQLYNKKHALFNIQHIPFAFVAATDTTSIYHILH